MSGYFWARTPENELFVVMMVAGMGYVPGVNGAINMDETFIIEPLKWPEPEVQSPNSADLKRGRRALAATHECVILPFAANA